jgi:hypothetical protein
VSESVLTLTCKNNQNVQRRTIMTSTSDQRSGVPHRARRLLAPRFIAIFHKWEGRSPAIRALGGVEVAEDYMTVSDDLVMRRADRQMEIAERQVAIEELGGAVFRWKAVVSQFVPLDPEAYRSAPENPDEVILSAERVLRLVADGGPLHGESFAAEMRDALTPLLEAARQERAEAAAAVADTQAMARRLREAARELQTKLTRFRAMLKSEVGTSHADYQALRATRVRDDGEVDDGDTDDLEADDESIPLESSVTSDAPVADVPGTDPPEAGADDEAESDVA